MRRSPTREYPGRHVLLPVFYCLFTCNHDGQTGTTGWYGSASSGNWYYIISFLYQPIIHPAPPNGKYPFWAQKQYQEWVQYSHPSPRNRHQTTVGRFEIPSFCPRSHVSPRTDIRLLRNAHIFRTARSIRV